MICARAQRAAAAARLCAACACACAVAASHQLIAQAPSAHAPTSAHCFRFLRGVWARQPATAKRPASSLTVPLLRLTQQSEPLLPSLSPPLSPLFPAAALRAKQIGKGCLPDDVNRSPSSALKGPLVLQVVSADDVSKPSRVTSTGAGDNKGRLLALKLTDGRLTCKALEYKRLDELTPDRLPPGTKVSLSNASIRQGIVLLEPRAIKVRLFRVRKSWHPTLTRLNPCAHLCVPPKRGPVEVS